MVWNDRESNAAYNPFSVDGFAPDKVVVISDWLKEIGGGVNTVMKDQIDCLSHDLGLAVDILMEGGDYQAPGTATFNTFPDPADADSIHATLRQHIVAPASQGQRIAAVLHNVLTVPFSEPLTQAFRRLVAEVERDPALRANINLTAWAYDVFDVPDEMVSGVTYVVISEARQKSVAEYFHQPPEKFPVISCAVNLRRMLELSPESYWLFNTYALDDEDFVVFYPVRLARNKNIDGAIRIVAALNRLGRSTTLLVPGATYDWEWEYYDELRNLAGELRIPEKVIFLTDLTFQGEQLTVSDKVIRDLYKLSSFLLFTSRDEGFGLPVIEAACWRLPVVISPLPPLMSVSHEAGVMVADADREAPESIAQRIINYLSTNPATAMRQRVFAHHNMRRKIGPLTRSCWKGCELPWRIGVQTTSHFRRWRIEDQFVDAVHNGLDAFEIFFDRQPDGQRRFAPEDLRDDFRQWMHDNARQRDVRLSVYAQRRIEDPHERRRHWDACLALARDVGAATLVVDLPPRPAFADGDFDAFVSDLQHLVDAATADRIQTAIENGSYANGGGGCDHTSADHLNDLYERLAANETMVGVCFNAGRAHLWGDPLSYLAEIAPPIIHVKLSDNLGSGCPEVHRRLGEGNLPLQSLLQEFKRRDYHGTMVLEYFYPDLRRDRKLIADQARKPPSRNGDASKGAC
jgi:glycosyltransferase involved in cell wall biosynthesis/sugar phosphate isomerase/epimerase